MLAGIERIGRKGEGQSGSLWGCKTGCVTVLSRQLELGFDMPFPLVVIASNENDPKTALATEAGLRIGFDLESWADLEGIALLQNSGHRSRLSMATRAVAGGAVGLFFGPVTAIAGVVAGIASVPETTKITVQMTFRNGRQIVGIASQKNIKQIHNWVTLATAKAIVERDRVMKITPPPVDPEGKPSLLATVKRLTGRGRSP